MRRKVFIPASHPAQFGVGTAPEQRRTHHPDDFAQELVLAPQTPFDLGHEVFGEAQGIEGLLEGLSGLLCLAAIAYKALVRYAATTLSGFDVLCSVSFAWGLGVLLDRKS